MSDLTLREIKGSPLTHQELDNNFINLIPAGAVFHFAMETCPSGYLICDGSIISRTEYSRLFNAIGTIYGSGDDTTTFQLPDLRDMFVRGKSESREIGSHQDDAFQGHRHSATTNAQRTLSANTGHFGHTNWNQDVTASATVTVTNPITDTVNGTPRTADETRPKNIALLPCIKY